MLITEEHVGVTVRRWDTGERFQIAAVSADGLTIRSEDGTQTQISGHVVNGDLECSEALLTPFHASSALAHCLNAAEQAAQRRLNSSSSDQLTVEEATQVSQLVQQQRQALHATRSFNVLLQSAHDRCTKPLDTKKPTADLVR